MENAQTTQQPFRTNAFTLKLAAIICMTCNHAFWILGSHFPVGVLYILYWVGGATFPIMAFLLVEGYRHTSNLKRYALRLLLWAVIAQAPFYLYLAAPADMLVGNVLFTLFLGLALLWTRDGSKGPAFWAMLVLVIMVSSFCDWGVVGPLVVLAFYLLKAGPGKDGRQGTLTGLFIVVLYVLVNALVYVFYDVAAGLSVADALLVALPQLGYGIIGCGIAGVLLYNYDSTLGTPLAKGSSAHKFNWNTLIKWGFYAYYPVHILVLGLIASLG